MVSLERTVKRLGEHAADVLIVGSLAVGGMYLAAPEMLEGALTEDPKKLALGAGVVFLGCLARSIIYNYTIFDIYRDCIKRK